MLPFRPITQAFPAAALVAGLLTVGCSVGEETGVSTVEGASIVLVSIDTLRSDHVPAYGYGEVETPAIDLLRRDGVLFERAYSQVPLTLPSHSCALTGLLPGRNGMRDNLGYRLDEETPYLPSLLSAAGYETAAFVSAFVLRRETGLDRGFDVYDDTIPIRRDYSPAISSRRGPETLRAALDWLAGRGKKPFFLFFHIYEPHTPHEAPEPFSSTYDSSYDAEIAAADDVVGGLFDELRRRGLYDGSLVILMSDHGEGLGDHGEAEHGVLLNREALQVPLIVKLPDGARAGETIDRPVGILDIAPTAARVVGLQTDTAWDGRSLFSPPRPSEERNILSESFYGRLHYGWSELLSVVRGRYHYVGGPVPELYDLEEDPGERDNILRRQRRLAETLQATLDRYGTAIEAPEDVDAETQSRLASLGYLTRVVETPDDGEPLPDPKTQMPTLEDLWAARAAQKEGEFEQALEASRRVLEANPRMVDAWEVKGNALEALDRQEEALEAYQRAMEIAGPSGYLVLEAARVKLELGRVDEALEGIRYARGSGAVDPAAFREMALHLAEIGRVEEALDVLRDQADSADPDARTAWARVLSEAGRQEASETVLRGILEDHPDHARAHEILGLVCLRQERLEEARSESEIATSLDPDLPDAWNNLGAALYLLGRRSEALEAWREAVAQDPKQYEALYNLGMKAPEVGDWELARWALRRFLEAAPPDRYEDDLRETRRLLERLGG